MSAGRSRKRRRRRPIGQRSHTRHRDDPGGPQEVALEPRQSAQAHVPEVLETWLAIMRSEAASPGTRAHVGELIYLRAFGRPTQEIAATSGPTGVIILPAEDEP